ncbi:MAG: DUF1080 domain-containing protein [Prolixibacteraceae bacterium]|nr:DUF1080 domain-containing protein [Prolixibacteraceae bacterium]MBN2775229.1 DUF1080 domain-containing protein [Prolixibacteraceae bacterium]
MKRTIYLSILILITLTLISAKPGWKSLFNGNNLDNWDKHIGSALRGFEELHKNAVPEKVFSVVDVNGEKLIRISGEVNGALATKEEYQNYHLQMVFKWGEKVYTSRNSGMLYHSFGEFGAAFGTWMACIESQMMHENLGDTYLMVNTNCETSVKKGDDGKSFIFDPEGEKLNFGSKSNGGSIKKAKNMEKPLGEWNTVDLYCFGRTAIHIINGEVVMVNTNCGAYDENGEISPLSGGKIQIQSEGGELFIKSIKIESIKKLPKKLLK